MIRLTTGVAWPASYGYVALCILTLIFETRSFANRPAAAALTEHTQASQHLSESHAAISGSVTDGMTHRLIGGALVSLTYRNRRGSLSTVEQLTDTLGRFVFFNLEASSSYSLTATKVGYFAGGHGSDGPQSPTDSLSLEEGEWIDGTNVALWPFASISGTVVDEHGEPVVEARVRTFAEIRVGDQLSLAAGPSGMTDDRGHYSILYLARGRYFVGLESVQATVPVRNGTDSSFVHPRKRSKDSGAVHSGTLVDVSKNHGVLVDGYPLTPSSRNGQHRVCPSIYYPAAWTIAEASAIGVEYGDNIRDVNLSVIPMPAYRVAGIAQGPATDLDGTILRLVRLGNDGRGLGGETATTRVADDGSFVFFNVPSGVYTIHVSPRISELLILPSPLSGIGTLKNVFPTTSGMRPARFEKILSGPGAAIWHAVHAATSGGELQGQTRIEVTRDLTGVRLSLARSAAGDEH